MRRALLILLTLWAVVGCHPTPIPPSGPTPPQPGDSAEMVLVGYFMGESNLISDLKRNMTQMERAVADGALAGKGRILIFLDSSVDGCIYELVNMGGRCEQRMLKNYAKVDSANPEVMCSIMNDIKALAPSNHYGLVFGGHGNGWVHKNLNISDLNVYGSDWTKRRMAVGDSEEEHEGLWSKYMQSDRKTRALGYDNANPKDPNNWLDMTELAEGVEALNPDFVLFDACSMASVEALWDLRGATRYVIASSAEIMIKGFPYTPIVKLLFSDWNDLAAVCAEFVQTYSNDKNMPNATVSLIDMERLDEVGSAVSKVLTSARKVEGSWLSNVDSLQYYEGIANHVFYDLGDCVRMVATDAGALAEFDEAMECAVLWEGHTLEGYSDYSRSTFPIKRSSGLTVYISRTNYPKFAAEYAKTAWAQDVGVIQYFNQQ